MDKDKCHTVTTRSQSLFGDAVCQTSDVRAMSSRDIIMPLRSLCWQLRRQGFAVCTSAGVKDAASPRSDRHITRNISDFGHGQRLSDLRWGAGDSQSGDAYIYCTSCGHLHVTKGAGENVLMCEAVVA